MRARIRTKTNTARARNEKSSSPAAQVSSSQLTGTATTAAADAKPSGYANTTEAAVNRSLDGTNKNTSSKIEHILVLTV